MKTRAALLRKAGHGAAGGRRHEGAGVVVETGPGRHPRQGRAAVDMTGKADAIVITGVGCYKMAPHEGHIKLTELITKQYSLDEINEGYQDLMDGKNIRGVVVHQH